MTSPFESQISRLGFSLPEWCVPATEQLVVEFEQQFGLNLPADYREFLVHHGGVVGEAHCAFQEPTPCGTGTCIDGFYGFTQEGRNDNVFKMTELIEGAPDVVAIGDNLMGAMFWLKCSGHDSGHVYMHDHEGRSAWPDEQFTSMYPNLDSTIREYLEQRRQGKLPDKPKGYDHVYRLASNFTEFVAGLEETEY